MATKRPGPGWAAVPRGRARAAGSDSRARQSPEEVLQIRHRGDAVVLAPDDQHRGLHLFRLHHRQVGGHVEIGAGRDVLAEGQFGIRQRLRHRHVGGARPVAGEDAADHVPPARPPAVRAVVVHLLRPLLQRGGAAAGIGEGREHQPPHPLRLLRREDRGPQRAGGLAQHEDAPLARLLLHQRQCGGEIGRAAADIGVGGGAGGPAIALVIHGPDIVAEAGEDVHQRVFATPRHRQVEAGTRGVGGAVHQEQHRPRRLSGTRRTEALAEEIQPDLALPRPVFGAPDLLLGPGAGSGGKTHRSACRHQTTARCAKPIHHDPSPPLRPGQALFRIQARLPVPARPATRPLRVNPPPVRSEATINLVGALRFAAQARGPRGDRR